MRRSPYERSLNECRPGSACQSRRDRVRLASAAACRLPAQQQPGGTLLGAVRTGLSVYELPPGQAVSPYHYEDPEEEWLLVVSGTPTLRHPGGEEQLEPWDLVFFPAGPAGAHLVRNNSESAARVAMLSSITAVGAVVYPDSDMIQISTTDGTDDIVVKRSSGVDVAAPWATGQGAAEAET